MGGQQRQVWTLLLAWWPRRASDIWSSGQNDDETSVMGKWPPDWISCHWNYQAERNGISDLSQTRRQRRKPAPLAAVIEKMPRKTARTSIAAQAMQLVRTEPQVQSARSSAKAQLAVTRV
jgi:hypothetical protein